MAYKRRYLAGQLAVTVDIADQAVTTDKIGDDAVGPTQIQDDAITTGKILDGEVKAADVGPLAITTEKLQESAVTSSKIASGAVTSDKLGADVQTSVRPFVPGLPTAEIGDAAITAVKIGAEAVETAKIKDGAVSSDKIAALAVTNGKVAPDSIGSDEIVASAITTSELANLSVSEGKIIDGSVSEDKIADNAVTEDKIQDDAVTTDKILDSAVTEDKILDDAITSDKLATAAIVAKHIDSLNVRVSDLSEEFAGQAISNRWRQSIDAGGSVIWDSTNEGLAITTPSIDGDGVILDFNNKGIQLQGRGARMTFYLPASARLRNWQRVQLGLFDVAAGNSHILFTAEDVAGATPNWFARCKEVGVETAVDTTIPISTGVQALTIEYISDVLVKFYIDGLLKATIITNIPSTVVLDPYISIIARSATGRTLYVQSMSLLNNRAAFV